MSTRYSAKELSMSDLNMKSFPQLVGMMCFQITQTFKNRLCLCSKALRLRRAAGS